MTQNPHPRTPSPQVRAAACADCELRGGPLAPHSAPCPWHLHTFRSGEPLFVEATEAREAYAVRSGFVRVTQVDKEGHTSVLRLAQRGDVLASDAMAGGVHGATATAAGDAVVCVAPTEHLDAAMRDGGDGAFVVVKLLNAEVEALRARVALLSVRSADARVARYVRLVAEAAGGGPLELPITWREASAYLALTPETVCRSLRRLTEAGVVRAEGRHLEVLDGPALAALGE